MTPDECKELKRLLTRLEENHYSYVDYNGQRPSHYDELKARWQENREQIIAFVDRLAEKGEK